MKSTIAASGITRTGLVLAIGIVVDDAIVVRKIWSELSNMARPRMVPAFGSSSLSTKSMLPLCGHPDSSLNLASTGLAAALDSSRASGNSFDAPKTALNGQDLLVSFPDADGLIQYGGNLQVFSLTSTGEWVKGTGFVPSVPTSRFGSSVSLSGNYILSSAGWLDTYATGYFLHTLE